MDRAASMFTFVQSVDAGSFAAAAERLGLTAPMVGRQVRALEDRLGVQLLTRTTRRHSLTEAGRIYYERAKAALAELEAADESVALMRAMPQGLLRIDAPVTFGAHVLAPALPEYLAANPKVRIELTLNNRLVDLVEEGYDAVVRTGSLHDSTLMTRALAPYRLLACAAPSYLARRGEPMIPADLAGHDCLGFRPGATHDQWTFIDEVGRTEQVRVTGPLSSNSGEVLRAAAVGGTGITMQAEALLSADVRAGRMVTVLRGFAPRPLPMSVLFAASRGANPKLRSFLDFLSERFGAAAFRSAAIGDAVAAAANHDQA